MGASDNKRIAKNTIYLNIRMVIVILVNLYVSRVALAELGADDYGIYNVVAGIVVLFAFLNNTMSAATSRFLTYEMGKGEVEKLKEVFQTSLFLHLSIAAILVVIAETVGLWFVNNHLVIPESRMTAVYWVYQFSILTMVAKIVQVPFNSSIIANERMEVYAWIEIIYAFTFLGLVYILGYWGGDKLIFYGILVFFVAAVSLVAYILYCLRHFTECSLKVKYEKSILKPMMSFTGFDLYANFSSTLKSQGITVLINWFYGPAVNAANAIANQIQAAIFNFCSTVTSAFRPQIVKKYAVGDLCEMKNLLNISSILSIILFSFIAVPIILEMDFIVKIWLGTPPEYTVGISQISIIANTATLINTILIIPIHATGRAKRISLLGGTVYLLTVPAAYLFMQLFDSPLTPYFVVGAFMILLVLTTSVVLKIEIREVDIINYYFKIIVPSLILIIVSGYITYCISSCFESGYLRVFISFAVYLIFSLALCTTYLYILASKEMRQTGISYIRNKIFKHE